MQGPLRLLCTVALLSSLATGCGRKKQEQKEAAGGSGAPAPAAETSRASAPAKDQREADREALLSDPAPAHPRLAAPADSPAAGAPGSVSADLSKTDEIYEAWFRKYKLDLNDPNMLDADPDQDGFTNRDEFLADTNPNDAKSHPSGPVANAEIHGGLKLKQYNEVRLPVVLESVEGDTAKIKRLDQADKVETVHAGQTVAGLGLRVEKVQTRRITDKHGNPVDASHLTLEDPETKEKTVLVKDMPARSGASYAVLTSADGKNSITVRQGDTFAWPKDGGNTFKVIDLRADQAVLQNENSGQMVTVLK